MPRFRSVRRRAPRPSNHHEGWAEFLETTWVRDWCPAQRDAWRNGRYGAVAVELPVSILYRLASPPRVQQIRQDHERLDWIRGQLADRGVDEPLLLVVDSRGRLTLADGHHRLVCAVDLGWDRLPVRVQTSERIRTHGVAVADVLTELLLASS